MTRSPARVAIDRLAVGALTGALTERPVAALAGFRRDAVAGLRAATLADVLDRALAGVAGDATAGGDGADRPVGPIARPRAPGGLDAPSPGRGGTAPPSLVSPGESGVPGVPLGMAGDGRGEAVSTIPAAPVTAASRALTSIGRTPLTSQAGGQPVTPSPVLDARALDAARRAGQAVPSTPPRPRFERPGPGGETGPASSSHPAIPQTPRPAAASTPATAMAPATATAMEVARRPKNLADLATLAPASTAAAAATAPSFDDRPGSAPWSDPPVARTASVPPQDLAPLAATGSEQRAGWPDNGAVSRTLPSPVADLAGAAAVLEAVLVHEARRYGVAVAE